MKKVPVVKFATPEAAAELEGLPLQATVAMADVSAAMREGLLAFATSAGSFSRASGPGLYLGSRSSKKCVLMPPGIRVVIPTFERVTARAGSKSKRSA